MIPAFEKFPVKPVNLFYEEPDDDRWFPFDRHPRRLIRRIVRGRPRPGGMARVFLNLRAGLDRLKIPYRVNDYAYIKRHPKEVACIVGKPCVLERIEWRNPILLGASAYGHPSDRPDLMAAFRIERVLVPCEWSRQMCEYAWKTKVVAWPVGIDTDTWAPECGVVKNIDMLIYDKVRWEHETFQRSLIGPIQNMLTSRGLSSRTLRYGFYREEEFHSMLARTKAMIFLCEHETQGIAYQQALSCGVPILAWDRGGYWRDPAYYPHRAQVEPVSSVPYWDDRCGTKFTGIEDFAVKFDQFMTGLERRTFEPRAYVLQNLTLEKCAANYLAILNQVEAEIGVQLSGREAIT